MEIRTERTRYDNYAPVAAPRLARRIAEAVEWMVIVFVRCLTRARPQWLGNVPPPGPVIYAANHASHLDVPLMLSVLPGRLWRRTRPVAAAGYWTAGPLRRCVIHFVLHGVLVERETLGINPLEPVAAALRQGDSLIFFPEGTRGPGDTLRPLRTGLFYLARWFPGVDIIPVWIGNSYRALPKGGLIPLPFRCSIAIGAPLRWKPEQGREEFLGEVRAALEVLHSQSR